MDKENVGNMLKNIYSSAVEAVMEESGLEFDRLAHGRDEMSVTARVVLVDALMEMGMSEAIVVGLSGMSQQRVNRLKNSARQKLRGLYGHMLHDAVEKRMRGILPNSE